MGTWIILITLYTVMKGLREGAKKKALEKSSVPEALFFYTAIAFVFVLPFSQGAFDVPLKYLCLIFVKSSVLFVAWICAFKSIRRLQVGLYGIMDMSRLLCSMLLAILVLGEQMTANQYIGLVLILGGLFAVNFHKKGSAEKTPAIYILLVLVSCFLNAVSGILDKIITKEVPSSALQFWYVLFLAVMYGIYLIATEKKIKFSTLKTNYWLIILSALFALSDRLLFWANADPASKVTVMSAMKQASVFVTIIVGKIAFGEKRFWYKIACAAVVVAGAVISVL